ncbi:3-oxoacyl-[acyl-carrier-protein] synthase III C-terminal domain-containing protein [Cellulosimicrobium composti]|uniref:3-oxoacyl-ACP synthase n=1 Tax=Cellulosimicrobium composti TaxID=2672572 RepID=A0A6N7ZNP9_9MICO|nr:3-oxoacyl-[acyl-carrier-protein] synthase III C-terminal domain-containing protein [Cellulosimicrobium composti]MTG90808.1 3-oxoacyl-ACP synthase [Cellulosimicrobium composti]NDO91055.1 3-oxoacyl-ACP synthase [Cellulosimicrobium composti]TWG81454.1 3-oxoacyl-[acyl-carrier-protein] synthase-3 [Cellulosimicrobium cellulans J34]SMF48660.1 3-oxoacyl-[acyl-carrier-protein] synthase-3 [Cellulosimicrobium cellulans J1]
MTTLVDVGAHVPATRVPIRDLADELGLDHLELGVFERFFGLREVCTAPGEDLADLLVAAARAVPGLAGNEHRVRYVLGARTIATVAPVGVNPLHDAATRLGLDHAVVWTLTQHACASALLAVDVAGRLLASDGDPDALALVLTGEKAFSPGSRLIEGTTIMGEGTAAVLVGADGSARRAGSPVLSYATRTLGEYHQVPLPEELAGPFGVAYTEVLAEVVLEAVERAGLVLDDLALVLPHNVNRVSWRRLCSRLGLPIARVRLDDVPVTGHCFGADSFIGYAAARAEGRLRPGDPFLMVAVGLGATFSAMVLRYAPHETEEPA